jgi:hypothetical protein
MIFIFHPLSFFIFLFSEFVSCCTVASLACNNPVVWRSSGFHYLLCGRQTFKYPPTFPRGYCRRCAKPHVSGCAFCPLYQLVSIIFFGLLVISSNPDWQI